MSETKIVWHPYPKEKPFSEYENIDKNTNKEISYLCTVKKCGKLFIAELTWHTLFKKFQRLYWIDNIDKFVTAWAEMPEPYNPKENNNESR